MSVFFKHKQNQALKLRFPLKKNIKMYHMNDSEVQLTLTIEMRH